MLTELAIADILPQGRQVHPTKDEVKVLAKSIQGEGLRHPIVVSGGVVIDGLKRIEAYKYLDLPKIQALVSENYEEICLELEKAREGESLDVGRQIDLMEVIEPLRMERVTEGKRKAGRARAGTFRGSVKVTTTPIPELLMKATGATRARNEILSTAIRVAKIDPEAREMLAEVAAGKMGVYAFQKWNLGRQREDLIPIVSAEEVRIVMERGLRTLATTVETMSKFGPATVLTLGEREQIAARINYLARGLNALVRLIRREITNEVEEQ